MAVALPDDLKQALDEANFAHLTTLDENGWPQTSAMWIMRDGDTIVFNTAEGRRKWRNMQRDPRVSFSLSPQGAPYTNFSVQGTVIEMRTEDGDAIIDELSIKYMGEPYKWKRKGMVRVTVIVEPTRVARN